MNPSRPERPEKNGRTGRLWKTALLITVCAVLAAPVIAVGHGALMPSPSQVHIWSVKGPQYVLTTLTLCMAVAAGVTLLGAGPALLVSLTSFPGRRILSGALIFPFAIPAYIIAYTYGDLFSPLGPVAALTGPALLPEIRSLPGTAFVMSLATYPYVYLAVRTAPALKAGSLPEAARSLGMSPFRAVIHVLLPAIRPALAGGLALALMETAADFGVADYFGTQTLGTGIFRTWYGLGDLTGATQLAAGLFLLMMTFCVLEEKGRSRQPDIRSYSRPARPELSPLHALMAIGACLIPSVAGFVIPVGVLVAKLDSATIMPALPALSRAIGNTLLVAVPGAAIVIPAALVFAYANRHEKNRPIRMLIRTGTSGYAVPGPVIAIGILGLAASVSQLTGMPVAGGSVTVLLYAFVIRFLTAGYNFVNGGLSQIDTQIDESAKSLGASAGTIIWHIHRPPMHRAIFAGAAIVAIDIAKELPATLLLRPFNFETLSTHIYRLASDERLTDAAPAALVLICISLVPVMILYLSGLQTKK